MIYVIEGNIGSSKTSLIETFKNDNNVEYYVEPIDIWQNYENTNVLKDYYETPLITVLNYN